MRLMPLFSQVLFFLTFFLLLSSTTQSREYPLPLKTIPQISGSFGELRRNHLHRGLDLRTFGQNGLPVYSPTDGWVKAIHGSDINQGFGQAIYLKHRDAYSSVYGHLMRFHSLHQLQAAFEMYQLMSPQQHFLIAMPEGWLSIKQGELFAFTGDKGSGVSHLHYEILSPDGSYLNPFPAKRYGSSDQESPTILSVLTYQLDTVNNLFQTKRCVLIKIKEQHFRCPEPLVVDGLFALKVTAEDTINALNKVAIYQAEVLLEGRRIFRFILDAMKPEESQNVTSLYDRARSYFTPPRYTYNLFYPQRESEVLPNYIKEQINKGWIDTSQWLENETKKILILISDISGNLSSVELMVQKKITQTALGKKESLPYNLKEGERPKLKIEGLVVSGNKLTSKAFLAVKISRVPKIKGLRVVSKAYQVKFYSATEQEKIEVCLSVTAKKQRGLYNIQGALLSNQYQAHRGYCTTLKQSATLVVAEDYLPPTIEQPYSYGPLGQSQVTLKVRESGSGVRTDKIDLILGGYWLTPEEKLRIGLYYDRDRRGFVFNTGFLPDASQHQKGQVIPLQARVYDNAGNYSHWFYGFISIP